MIDLVLDIGANTGDWARQLRRDGFRGRIVSFEPLSAAFAQLDAVAADDPLWECHRLALGDRDGEAELHVAGNSLSSSLLSMRGRHLEAEPESTEVGTETVALARLDSLVPDLTRGARTFLKLDVQGFELHVLHGAASTLGGVAAVQAELSLAELYEGQPLLPEVVAFLADAGFALTHLEPGFRDVRSDAILQLDGIFVRVG